METHRIRFRRVLFQTSSSVSSFWPSPPSGERTQWVPLSLLFVCQSELTEFFAELTEFAAELSEFSPLKRYSRNSIPPVPGNWSISNLSPCCSPQTRVLSCSVQSALTWGFLMPWLPLCMKLSRSLPGCFKMSLGARGRVVNCNYEQTGWEQDIPGWHRCVSQISKTDTHGGLANGTTGKVVLYCPAVFCWKIVVCRRAAAGIPKIFTRKRSVR